MDKITTRETDSEQDKKSPKDVLLLKTDMYQCKNVEVGAKPEPWKDKAAKQTMQQTKFNHTTHSPEHEDQLNQAKAPQTCICFSSINWAGP